MKTSFLSILTTLILTACSPYPRDPEHTFDRVFGQTLIVGVIKAPKRINVSTENQFSGPEAELIKKIAQEMKANIKWQEGSSDKLFASLRNYKIHLLVGGLTQDNPWKQEVAFTKAYDNKYVLALPPGENRWLVAIEKIILVNEASP